MELLFFSSLKSLNFFKIFPILFSKKGGIMVDILIGAYYENKILYIEAFDKDNLMDLDIRHVSSSCEDAENPTPMECSMLSSNVEDVIQDIMANGDDFILRYQGPSKSQHSDMRHRKGQRIRDMTPWAQHILETLDNLCTENGIEFKQKRKTSKPKTNRKRRHGRTVVEGINFSVALKEFISAYLDEEVNMKTCHSLAAALELGNSNTNYKKWIRRFETQRIRSENRRMTNEALSEVTEAVNDFSNRFLTY